MQQFVHKEHVEPLIGKNIYAIKKDGTIVTGKLLKLKGQQLILEQRGDKQAKTKFVLPLVLFDLLAIGTAGAGFGGFGPFGFGGFGPGFGGFGGPFFW